MGTSYPWVSYGWQPSDTGLTTHEGHWRAAAQLAGIPWERWDEVLTRSGLTDTWAHTAYAAPSAANLATLKAAAVACGVQAERIDLFLSRLAALTAADFGVHSCAFA